MPRRRVLRSVLVALATVATVAALTSCGSNELDRGGASGDSDTASSATDPPTTTGADPGVPENDLEPLMPERVPDGFVQEDDEVGDTGPSDLDKAVRDDGSEDARDALVEEGFVQGYQRLWTNPAGDELIVFLYEFATPEGALADLDRQKSSNEVQATEGFAAFAPSGLEPAVSFGFAGSNGERAYAAVATVHGAYHAQVVASGDGEDVELMKTRASDLMAAQLERL